MVCKLGELSTESGLTDKELELCARVIRSAPVTTKALREADPVDSIDTLVRLVRAGFFTQSVFKELVLTPRMKELLSSGRSGCIQLREFAGFEEPKRRVKTGDYLPHLIGRERVAKTGQAHSPSFLSRGFHSCPRPSQSDQAEKKIDTKSTDPLPECQTAKKGGFYRVINRHRGNLVSKKKR
jgi:hypothetical protein